MRDFQIPGCLDGIYDALQNKIALPGPYRDSFIDALRDSYEQVWTGAAHGALGFDTYEEGMAGCGKSESRLIRFCVLTIWDGSSLYIELLCF